MRVERNPKMCRGRFQVCEGCLRIWGKREVG